ncbi:MAG TPA: hypothetical protein VHG92_07890 [Afifellaceae bacterium]|nr:hypothetical protein [Afifellaceae bacterium]
MRVSISVLPAAACALMLASVPAAAHEEPGQSAEGPAALHAAEHEEHGSYIVDQKGMALYLFEADNRGGEGSQAESACRDDCATAWPPFLTEGDPQAHDELKGELLGTIERDEGATQVTYNGWPLYRFAADAEPGHTRGHDIETHGAEWYLVTPEGEKAGEEH